MNIKFIEDLNVSISLFEEGDAPGVAALFRKVYGEGYPVKLVYNPEALIAAFKAKNNIPVVGRTADGNVIAYQGIYRSAPNNAVYEAGQGLVHPDYRGKGINNEINRYMDKILFPELAAECIFGEAVCNHTYMQKSWGAMGHDASALEVDLMPHEAYSTEKSASGRVSAIIMGTVDENRPAVVYLPAPYEESLRFLYRGLDNREDFLGSDAPLPHALSDTTIQIFDFAGVARVAVNEAGADFERFLTEKETELIGRNVVVIQVWLKLSCPFVGKLTEILRRRNYFLGGLLPRWFAGSDGLLMQKLVEPPNWDGIHLYSEKAKVLLKMVKKDWEETCLP